MSDSPTQLLQERPGQAALATVLFLLLAVLAVTGSFGALGLREVRSSRIDLAAKRAYFAAEAGTEDLAWRIRHGKAYQASQTVTLDGLTATVTVESASGRRIVESRTDSSGAVRAVRAELRSGTGVSFTYGVQVGAGGLELGDNSSVNGSVYSNGDIAGNGASKSTITGTAKSAGNHLTKDIRVDQDAYSARFDGCSIGGTAYYLTVFTDCTAGRTASLGQELPAEPFPITQEQIDSWKADAAAGGTLSGYSLGNNNSASLGPKKIAGNITLGNSATLTITGTVWVTGTISFGNTDIIRLAPAYSGDSGLMIVDGAVTTGNSATLEGSGQAGSYLMLLSLSGADPAIDIGNSATSAILYAPNGIIDIGNNLTLREATAYGLDVGNGAEITYEAGLADVTFSGGPAAGWQVRDWSEIK